MQDSWQQGENTNQSKFYNFPDIKGLVRGLLTVHFKSLDGHSTFQMFLFSFISHL